MEKRIKKRVMMLTVIFMMMFPVFFSRIVWYQVINQDFWMDKALSSWSTKREIPASRGTIYDRNGAILAIDGEAYTVIVNPKLIQMLEADPDLTKKRINIEDEIVNGLSDILHKSKDDLYKMVSAKRDNGEYYVQREVRNEGYKMDPATTEQVQSWIKALEKRTGYKNNGVSLIAATKRYYPNGRLASHILGYMDQEGNPVQGIEAGLDDLLHEENGWSYYHTDGKGYKVAHTAPSDIYEPPKDGKDIYLTIDARIQAIVEEAMRNVYQQYSPVSMTVIAMEPQSGDVLAMANMPDYDPNRYWEVSDMASFYNHAVQSVYEPGSTFKIVTLAAAVEERVFKPYDSFQSGEITVGGKTIRDVKRGGWGPITYLDGLKRSSNVGFVKIGYEQLGEQKLASYIRQFGFGQETGIQLPNEVVKQIDLKYPADFAAASYGHGQIWITPIQQANGVSAVANGGQLLQPNLIHKIADRSSKEETLTEAKVVRRVLSEETAQQVGEYLRQVVSDQEIGTGRYAYIDGYQVAGKTGTSIKAVNGKYSEDANMYSFVGYAPADHPKLLVYVIVDDPQHYEGGSMLTSQLFREIMLRGLQVLQVPPDEPAAELPNEKSVSRMYVPKVEGLKLAVAEQLMKDSGVSYQIYGTGSKVIWQYPSAQDPYTGGMTYIFTQEPTETELPPLTGKSLRDALQICSLIEYSCEIAGEGYVVSQQKSMDKPRTSVLTLQPKFMGD